MKDESKYLSIDAKTSELRIVHNLLLCGIDPRPTTLVSTSSEDRFNIWEAIIWRKAILKKIESYKIKNQEKIYHSFSDLCAAHQGG